MKKTMEDLQEGMKKTMRTIRDLQGERRGTIKESMDDLCEALENEIISGNADEETKKELLKKFRKFCNTETNIMLVGATGSGKSSTINALFGCGETETLMRPIPKKTNRNTSKSRRWGAKRIPRQGTLRNIPSGN